MNDETVLSAMREASKHFKDSQKELNELSKRIEDMEKKLHTRLTEMEDKIMDAVADVMRVCE